MSTVRSWIIKTLERANFPAWVRHIAKASMFNAHFISNEDTFMFKVTSGVGQGCTTAATLYTIAAEPIIDFIKKHLRSEDFEIISVYADDTSFTLAEIRKLIPMHNTFQHVKDATRLCINFDKTVIIPLGHEVAYDDLSREAAQLRGTPWELAKLSTEVTITGVLLGPSASD